MNDPQERRRHPRALATFDGMVGDAACVVEGLSEGGARLRGFDARAGDRIVVDVSAPGGMVRAVADVVRRDDDGVGVAFASLSDDARRIVRAAAELAPTARGSVLVVDHSEAWRTALAADVCALGYPIVTAASAIDAIARIEDPDRDVECIFIDRALPDIDGADLVSFLAVHYPHVRRVLVDGADHAPDSHATLQKPWTRLALVCALAP